MKVKCYVKKYKDKIILLPLDEFSWQQAHKIFNIKFGFLKWTVKFSFNF